jgi:hypothetical protein
MATYEPATTAGPAPGGFGTIARFSIPKLPATPEPFGQPE